MVLLFTGRYPQRVFDLVLGLNRWVLRVAGYVAGMTDRYPPFSLDQGGHEEGWGTSPPGGVLDPPPIAPVVAERPSKQGPAHGHAGWTAGRVTSLVVGSLLVLLALGLGGSGGALAVADQAGRDSDGFLMSPHETLSSASFAITSDSLEVHADAPSRLPQRVVGDVRFTADGVAGERVFLGVAATADVERYLGDVGHDTLVELRDGDPVYRSTEGGAPATAPTDQGFWLAQDSGVEDVEVTWPLEDGDWTVVVMGADGTAGIAADVAAGAELPGLSTLIGVLLVSAGIVLAVGVLLVAAPIRAASRGSAEGSGS